MADEGQQNQISTGDTGQGGGDAKWYDSLPDDLKGNTAITGLDGIESMAKGYLEATAKVSEFEASKPAIPDKPEGYELPTKFEGIPDSITKEAAASIARNALAAGLTKDQAGKLMAGLLADEKASMEQAAIDIKKAQDATVEGLKKDFGEKWEEKVNNGILRLSQIAGAAKLDPEQFKSFLNETGIGDHPLMIRWAIALADLISPDVFEKNSASSTSERTAAQKLYPSMSA